MAKWKKSGTKGVRFYEHETRRHGVKLDRYFAIRYQVDGKRKEEGIGWASDKWSAVNAAEILVKLRKNNRRGSGPRTLAEMRKEQSRQQKKLKADGLTLDDFWENDYSHHLKARLTNKNSRIKEESHYKMRIKPIMGSKPLKDIPTEAVELMVDRMRAEGLAPRTQQYAVGTLFRIWKHAAKRKYVKAGDNPAAGVHVEKVNNARLRVLTREELQAILDLLAGMDPAAHDITMFCAFTGCRFSEAARLTWEHVDLTRGTALFLDTKNKESREIYLVPELLERLERRGVGSTGEQVFKRQSDLPYLEPPKSFRQAVEHLKMNKDRDPRDKVTFHSLRHTAATLAARRGTPIKDLQVLFGWKTPAMVFRYAKGDEDTQRRAMQGLAQSLTTEPAKVVPMLKTGTKGG